MQLRERELLVCGRDTVRRRGISLSRENIELMKADMTAGRPLGAMVQCPFKTSIRCSSNSCAENFRPSMLPNRDVVRAMTETIE